MKRLQVEERERIERGGGKRLEERETGDREKVEERERGVEMVRVEERERNARRESVREYGWNCGPDSAVHQAASNSSWASARVLPTL